MKPEPIFDGDTAYRHSAERSLWSAVIYSAFEDLNRQLQHSMKQLKRSEAYRFYFSEQRHFDFVCGAAGFNPDFIKMCARKIIAGSQQFNSHHRVNVTKNKGQK